MEPCYAIVHGDPPELYLSDTLETLQWVLALEVVASTSPEVLGSALHPIRDALLREDWSEAVVEWINATGQPIDVYPGARIYQADDVAMGGAELQFTRLFRGYVPDDDA
ncbi:MAG: hypothetical protein ACXWCM_12790 [Acidimicrobiales bacterium]